jgi:hypothetical protein
MDEPALLVDGNFNAGKLKSVLPVLHVQPEIKKTTFTPHTETHTKLSLAIWQI